MHTFVVRGSGSQFDIDLPTVMNKYIVIVAAFAFLSISQDGLAQDDPWWKNLFKKETVDEIEEDKTTEKSDVPEEDTGAKDTIVVVIPVVHEPGRVTVNTPYALDTLNKSLIENPDPTSGFRIQIFFGSLAEAKKQRSVHMSKHKNEPCYLVQNIPNFAVRVGDFRSKLEAYRRLTELRGIYPSAYVVPDEIEFPQLTD